MVQHSEDSLMLHEHRSADQRQPRDQTPDPCTHSHPFLHFLSSDFKPLIMSAAPLPLRCKTRSGQQMVENLTMETTVADFRAVLSGLSDIGMSRLRVLSGFPPQPLDLSDEAARLSSLGLRPRDTVIIEELKYELIGESTRSLQYMRNMASVLFQVTSLTPKERNQRLFHRITDLRLQIHRPCSC